VWRITMLLQAAQGLDREEAFQGLLARYAKVLQSRLAQSRPQLRQIVVSCASPTPGSGLPEQFDAGVELYFDEEGAAGQTLATLTQDREWLAELARWCDVGSMVAWMGECLVKLDLPGANIRMTVTGDIADGWTVADALRYWHDQHPVVARSAAQFWRYVRRYVQIHGRHSPATPLYRPMAAEMGFESLQDLITAYSHPQYLAIVRPDEMKFAKAGELMIAFATTRRQVVLER